MKKLMNKVIALLITTVLVMGSMLTVMATERSGDTTYTITITDTRTGHTYEAYQIFAGELSTDGGKLSNITWGSGVIAESVAEKFKNAEGKELEADTVADRLTDTASAQAFAKKIASCLANTPTKTSTEGKAGDTVVYTIAGLEPGYYFIKDKDKTLAGKDDSYTSYMLKVVKSQNITTKADMSEVEKKVKDINDTNASGQSGWQDSADYDIKDTVPFQLKAKLAHNVASYEKYKVVFHDTLSPGLTYDGDNTVNITIDGRDVKNAFTITHGTTEAGETTLEFACDDVKDLGATGDNEIIVEYTATLNDKAKLGAEGNPNKVYLEYSNNPNQTGEGTPETGKTPEDVVIVFTYKVVINKVDKDANSLPGATFKLEKIVKDKAGESSTKVVVDEYEIPAEGQATQTTFSFAGLDDGEYVLTETNTPDGYNTMDPVTFIVTAHHDESSDAPKLTSLSGNPITGAIILSAGKNTDGTFNGELEANVVNYQGSELPETGGMGTTLFYILGTILVLGTGVVLVTRKRMEK